MPRGADQLQPGTRSSGDTREQIERQPGKTVDSGERSDGRAPAQPTRRCRNRKRQIGNGRIALRHHLTDEGSIPSSSTRLTTMHPRSDCSFRGCSLFPAPTSGVTTDTPSPARPARTAANSQNSCIPFLPSCLPMNFVPCSAPATRPARRPSAGPAVRCVTVADRLLPSRPYRSRLRLPACSAQS